MLANKCPDIEVTVVDLDPKRIEAWKSQNLPIYEPFLLEQVQLPRDGTPEGRRPNLFFSTDVDAAIAAADLIFMSVNTPTKVSGQGAGLALDLAYLETAIRKVAEVSTSNKIIVEKSTVPCRTADSLRDILSATGKPGVDFYVLSNPEFLAEGTSIPDLLYPDRILIGSLNDSGGQQAAKALADIYAQWVPQEKIVLPNLWSSELAKMAANALLAQRISSINSISAICEATGADIAEVSYAVGLDKRIGPHMLKSSVGFGGSCFQKDVLGLVYLAEALHFPEVASYWRSVVDINNWQKDRFTKLIISSLNNTLTNKKVAIFGFAYKKNTGDTRETAAISVINQIIAERAHVTVYDPQVKTDHILYELKRSNVNPSDVEKHVTVVNTPYEAAHGAHAVVILTEWDEFKSEGTTSPPSLTRENSQYVYKANGDRQSKGAADPNRSKHLDWSRIAQHMQKPMFVFDGRNVIKPKELEDLGFRVSAIGRPNKQWAFQ